MESEKKQFDFKLLKKIFDGTYELEDVKECLCGSCDLDILSRQERFALPFGTKICKQCGLIQLSPRISFKDLSDFYKDIYYDLMVDRENMRMKGTCVTYRLINAQKIYEYLKQYVIDRHTKRLKIIEIGCGYGNLLSNLKKIMEKNGVEADVLGCDHSEDVLKFAREKNIVVYNGGAESLLGKEADILVLNHVVEHFGDIKKEFENIKKLIRRGGYLYIEVPGVCNLRTYDYNYINYTFMAHNYYFNLLSLRFVIEHFGFKFITGNEYVRSFFQYDISHVPNLDVTDNYSIIIDSLKKSEAKRIKNSKSRIRKLRKVASRIKRRVLSLCS